jgi:hypothetical protein
MEQGEIILYQPDEAVKLEVRLEDETVWLTQAQIVDLFQSSKANISEHIKNIYDQKELEESSTVRDFRTVRQEGKRQVMRNLTYYNLDAIISIGFRVNSKRGILFRQWANKVLSQVTADNFSQFVEAHKLMEQAREKLQAIGVDEGIGFGHGPEKGMGRGFGFNHSDKGNDSVQ